MTGRATDASRRLQTVRAADEPQRESDRGSDRESQTAHLRDATSPGRRAGRGRNSSAPPGECSIRVKRTPSPRRRPATALDEEQQRPDEASWAQAVIPKPSLRPGPYRRKLTDSSRGRRVCLLARARSQARPQRTRKRDPTNGRTRPAPARLAARGGFVASGPSDANLTGSCKQRRSDPAVCG